MNGSTSIKWTDSDDKGSGEIRNIHYTPSK